MTTEGFVFDYAKCVGCHACIVACYVENKTQPPIVWRQINTYNSQKIPLAGFLNLSIACNHCVEAPCLIACPAKAYTRDVQTGAVIHQPEKCIGCQYCTWACPFDAPKYNPSKGIVEKCHLCNHLVSVGSKPACTKQCPTGALSYGLIDKMGVSESFGLPKTSHQPRFIATNANVVDVFPEQDISISGLEMNIHNNHTVKLNTKIHSRDEWPLIIFTFVYSFLAGSIFLFANFNNMLLKVVYLTIGLLGILLSAFHLGKPFRAPRSILNYKTSWLSREILFSGLFFISSNLYLFVFRSNWMLVIASLLGLMLLVSIERVYSITRKNYVLPIHSSNTILTALLFVLLFSGLWKLLVGLMALKALLYILRKAYSYEAISLLMLLVTAARVLLGLIIPIGIISFSNASFSLFLLFCLIVGEFIDRYEFYNDIYIDTPSRELEQSFSRIA